MVPLQCVFRQQPACRDNEGKVLHAGEVIERLNALSREPANDRMPVKVSEALARSFEAFRLGWASTPRTAHLLRLPIPVPAIPDSDHRLRRNYRPGNLAR